MVAVAAMVAAERVVLEAGHIGAEVPAAWGAGVPAAQGPDGFVGFDPWQASYHQRWQHLRDPDVRALAWLLDSPDLFDANWPLWQGRVAHLQPPDGLDAWLSALDAEPSALKAVLVPGMRLGRHAEKLLGFYLQQQGVLHAQGVPVRAAKNDTIGEFDFLWRDGSTLVHWEFATKFYLYEDSVQAGHAHGYFIGPNLADSLDAKMGKILQRQLALGQHPAAQAVLPQPLGRAQALVKGWLFYREPGITTGQGLAGDHCRGFWCPLAGLDAVAGEYFALLPRRNWLAPAALDAGQILTRGALTALLEDWFAHDSMPQMVLCLCQRGEDWLEARRGFIVPNDWQQRAWQRFPLSGGSH